MGEQVTVDKAELDELRQAVRGVLTREVAREQERIAQLEASTGDQQRNPATGRFVGSAEQGARGGGAVTFSEENLRDPAFFREHRAEIMEAMAELSKGRGW